MPRSVYAAEGRFIVRDREDCSKSNSQLRKHNHFLSFPENFALGEGATGYWLLVRGSGKAGTAALFQISNFKFLASSF